jgi:RNA polymerase sigma factor (sigma-70 family)
VIALEEIKDLGAQGNNMKEKEDSTLIKEVVEQNSSDALIELSERHSGVYYDMVKRHLPGFKEKSKLDDFYERKIEVIYDAICSFNEDKGVKFVTWLANKTKYVCLTERTKLKSQPEFHEFVEEMGGSTDLSGQFYSEVKEESQRVLEKIELKFSEKHYKIFKDVYFGGKNSCGATFAEVGKKYGVSPQAVQATNKKIINYLKKSYAV